MYGKLILLISAFTVSSQQVIQQCPNIFLSETIRPPAQYISTAGLKLPTPQVPGTVIAQDNTANVCKDLAHAVEAMVLNRLLDSSRRKPVFNQIAGSLLNDLVVRTGCPACGAQVSKQVLVAPGSQPCLNGLIAL